LSLQGLVISAHMPSLQLIGRQNPWSHKSYGL